MEAIISIGELDEIWDLETSRFVKAAWLATQHWYHVWLYRSDGVVLGFDTRQASLEAARTKAAKEARYHGAERFKLAPMRHGEPILGAAVTGRLEE